MNYMNYDFMVYVHYRDFMVCIYGLYGLHELWTTLTPWSTCTTGTSWSKWTTWTLWTTFEGLLKSQPRVLETCLYWPGDTWWTSDRRVRTVTRDTWLVAGAWPESLMSMSRDHQPITACVSLTNQPITTRGDNHVVETLIRNIILTGA